jgi:hypothetical protein
MGACAISRALGFVGADPEQRQARNNNGSKFTVLSVATTIKKGLHVLVEGSLVSTTHERGTGKGKKAKTNKQTFRCIRAVVVRKLDRGEPEPETVLRFFRGFA